MGKVRVGARPIRMLSAKAAVVCLLLASQGLGSVPGCRADDDARASPPTPRGVVCAQGKKVAEWDDERVKWISFSPDGAAIAVVAREDAARKVLILSSSQARQLSSIELHRTDFDRSPVRDAVEFSRDGKSIFALRDDRTLVAMDFSSGKVLKEYVVKGPRIEAFVFSPDGRRVAIRVGHSDETREIRVVEWQTGEQIAAIRERDDLVGGSVPTTTLAFCPDGSTLGFVCWSKMIYLWNYRKGKEPLAMEGHESCPSAIAFSTNRDMLLSSGGGFKERISVRKGESLNEDSGVRVWSLARHKQIAMIPAGAFVRQVALSPDGCTFATFDALLTYNKNRAPSECSARVWELASGKEILRFRYSDCRAVFLAYSPTGDRLAVAWEDGSVVVWPLATEICGPPKESLGKEELAGLWHSLSEQEKDGAFAAYRAVCKLSDYPSQSVPLIRDRVKPVEVVKKEHLQSLIADLDHDDFSRREAAGKELARLMIQAEPLLREALETTKSTEQAKRLKALLKGPETWLITDPELLQAVRAIWVLQRIGTPEAKALLEKLAAGAPTARQTQEAQAALEYLKRSKGR